MSDEREPEGLDATEEDPELFALTREAGGYALERRGFMKAAAALAAAATGVVAGRAEAAKRLVVPKGNRMLVGEDTTRGLPRAHSGGVWAVAFSPDGARLVSTCSDRLRKVWSLPEGALVATMALGKTEYDSGAAITPDGRLLASWGLDTVRVLGMADGKVHATLRCCHRSRSVPALSPDGALLAWPGADTVELWSVPDGKRLSALKTQAGRLGGVDCVTFSPDGEYLASGSGDTVRLWGMPDGRLMATMEAKTGAGMGAQRVTFSPDGKLLASTGYADTARLWSVPDGRPLATLGGRGVAMGDLTFSSDGKLLASAGDAKPASLWSVPDGGFLGNLQDPLRTEKSLFVRFSPDGRSLAGWGEGEPVRLWSRRPWGLPATLPEQAIAGAQPATAGPGGMLLVLQNDYFMRLRSFPDGAEVARLDRPCVGFAVSAAVSSDARLLASGDRDGHLLLWELDGERRCWVLFDPQAPGDQTKLIAARSETQAGPSVCTCNAIWLPAETALPPGAVCVCNTIVVGAVERGGEGKAEIARTTTGDVCLCDSVCGCNKVCTCNTVSRDGGWLGGDGHYWYPN